MEQDTQTVRNYHKMTTDAIRANYLNFAVGTVIVLAALSSLAIRYGTVLQTGIENQIGAARMYIASLTDQSQNESIQKVSEFVKDDSINYISPVPKQTPTDNLGIVSEENGQISSISSDQVTYQRNKYVIQPGESLQDVARKVYGDPNAWVRIAQANNITNPDYIEVGMELVIPR